MDEQEKPLTDIPWRRSREGLRVQAGDESEPYTVANTHSGPFAPAKDVARRVAERIVEEHNALLGVSTPALRAGLVRRAVEALRLLAEWHNAHRPGLYDPPEVERLLNAACDGAFAALALLEPSTRKET